MPIPPPAPMPAAEEAIKGTLTPGKLADLVVLSQDIFTIDPMAILETEVVGTMVGGEWVYGEDRLLSDRSRIVRRKRDACRLVLRDVRDVSRTSRSRSHTTFPPTTVISTLTSLISSSGTAK